MITKPKSQDTDKWSVPNIQRVFSFLFRVLFPVRLQNDSTQQSIVFFFFFIVLVTIFFQFQFFLFFLRKIGAVVCGHKEQVVLFCSVASCLLLMNVLMALQTTASACISAIYHRLKDIGYRENIQTVVFFFFKAFLHPRGPCRQLHEGDSIAGREIGVQEKENRKLWTSFKCIFNEGTSLQIADEAAIEKKTKQIYFEFRSFYGGGIADERRNFCKLNVTLKFFKSFSCYRERKALKS